MKPSELNRRLQLDYGVPVVEMHPVLMCGLLAVTFDETSVTLCVPADHCTDMEGAIAVATVINPYVKRINTVNRLGERTTYHKCRTGWIAER